MIQKIRRFYNPLLRAVLITYINTEVFRTIEAVRKTEAKIN